MADADNICPHCKIDRRQCRCCCGDTCPYLDADGPPEGSCEGPVTVVDEELFKDEEGYFDSAWVHRCEKHAKIYWERGY